MAKLPPPRAYSYLRFSSPEQAKGDSLRRQVALSEAWCQKQGMILDVSLRMTDSGVSAFRGANGTEGALGAFLRAIERGDVPRGSFLLVESLDRLSRDQVHRALRQFLHLIEKGITIVTLSDSMIYSEASISESMVNIIISIVIMSRAHEESAMKSQRLRASWEQKRSRLKEIKMTSRAPAWLRLSADRKTFEVIEERAAVVNKIFTDTLRGLGRDRIAGALNDAGYDTWGEGGRKGRKWHDSYISKILESEAVIGRYQPHKMVGGKRTPVGEVLEGYYPAIVSEDLFYRVRSTRPGKPCMPGPTGATVANLFTHLAKCARTGAPALYSDKGKWRYLKSDAVLPDGRKMRGWPYAEFETVFFAAMDGLDLTAIFGETRADLDSARGAVATAEARVEDVEQKLSKLFAFVEGADGKPPASAYVRLAELEVERTRCNEEAENARGALDSAERSTTAARDTKQALHALLVGTPNLEKRLALRAEIRRIVDRIEILFDVPETQKEREERLKMEEAALMFLKAGAKVLQNAEGDIPKRSFTIVFTNGVRRSVIEGKRGTPLVYEATESGTDFSAAVMLVDVAGSLTSQAPEAIAPTKSPKIAKAKKSTSAKKTKKKK